MPHPLPLPHSRTPYQRGLDTIRSVIKNGRLWQFNRCPRNTTKRHKNLIGVKRWLDIANITEPDLQQQIINTLLEEGDI